MKRAPVALLAALEALIALAIGVGVLAVPATLIWAIGTGFAAPWSVFWQGAADLWLLGNGVHLRVDLPEQLVAPLGLAGAADPFVLSLAPLAVTALTLFLGVRAGLRSAGAEHCRVALVSAVVAYAALSAAIVLSTGSEWLQAGRWSGFLFPPLIFGAAMALGILIGLYRRGESVLPERFDPFLRWGESARAATLAGLRAAAIAVTGLVGTAALLVTVLLLVNYPLIVGLYESTQLGAGGGVVVTLAQLLYLPTFVIWAASWIAGPGFAIGAGSVFSPLGTVAGPIPAVPLFGVLPSGGSPIAWLLLILPLVCGFAAGVWVRRARVDEGTLDLREGAIAVAVAAVAAGAALALLAWFAAGSLGPGRLAEMGPRAWLVGPAFLVEVGIGAALGLVSGTARARH